MKRRFSSAWVSSKQVRKQRKYRYNAPLHTKHSFLNAHLSEDLSTKYGKRSLPLRKGDEVLVMRGTFRKKKGKILSIDLKRTRITIEGLERTKRDGTKINVFFHPSAVMLQTLGSDDKERISTSTKKENKKEKSK